MDIHKSKMLKYETIQKKLQELFDAAKEKDEFEYCCALLRIEGSKAPGWDPMQESHTLLMQALSFASSPIDAGFKIRLLLLAYCHAMEMNSIYNMTANMLQISQGEEYCTDWFHEDYAPIPFKQKLAAYPAEKIERLYEWAMRANQKDIAGLLNDMLLKDIRNAFDHSDYIIYRDELRIIKVDKGYKKHKIYKLSELIPKLELGINIVLIIIALTHNGIRAYKISKKVKSRMLENDPDQEMILTVDPQFGLTGFQSVIKGRYMASEVDNARRAET